MVRISGVYTRDTLRICGFYTNSLLGLGDHLHSLDLTREWDEHLQYILVFCTVHLKRNFAKKFPNHPARYSILDLIFGAKNRGEVAKCMHGMCLAYPELKSWLVNKQPQWLLSGIAQAESRILPEYWLAARKHTGNSESSHFQENNFTGRKVSLLCAVLRCEIHLAYAPHMLTRY